jgi:hypothetical protein
MEGKPDVRRARLAPPPMVAVAGLGQQKPSCKMPLYAPGQDTAADLRLLALCPTS